MKNLSQSQIEKKIYEVRGHRVMLDSDLAILYETETKYITRAVKRNVVRFPSVTTQNNSSFRIAAVARK